ncbi:uncharacterized protein LOC120991812 [Bufo bufo]|uniref:uncharacterized protein LOC120991812 n=1 Tax=Bufo bufo TaxID=8384 RepID=UPI001ABE34F2|nr:uncharacterized protein LOC120991812 [Bufo bufo]
MVIQLYATIYLFLQSMALGEICITQDPALNVSYLDIARISCHWNSDKGQQFRVVWRKHISSPGEENGTELCSVLRTENSSNSEVRSKITCNATNNSSLLTIHGVTKDDGGKYVCEVTREIPTLKKGRGDGTQLYVQDDIRAVFIPDIKFLYLTILLIIPILIIVCCLYCKRKKKKDAFRDHIYGNVKRNTSRSSKQSTCKKSKSYANKTSASNVPIEKCFPTRVSRSPIRGSPKHITTVKKK